MERKQKIRAEHLAKRNALSLADRTLGSSKISQNLIKYFHRDLTACQKKGVYGYYPHRSEVSLMELYAWLSEQRIPLAFPVVNGSAMEFYQVDSMEDFVPGAFGIMEPFNRSLKAEFKNAVCLVPGSVFDRTGNRYGYGKGYYDRYFSIHEGVYRIGVAYAAQVEAQIPAERCDVKMHALVTEDGMEFYC